MADDVAVLSRALRGDVVDDAHPDIDCVAEAPPETGFDPRDCARFESRRGHEMHFGQAPAALRDLEGLADRLADLDAWQWRDGFGDMFITGQDLGVLDELLKVGVPLRASSVVSLTSEQATSLTRLREFLQS